MATSGPGLEIGFEALDVGQEPGIVVRLELLMQTLCPEPLLLFAHDDPVSATRESEGHMWRKERWFWKCDSAKGLFFAPPPFNLGCSEGNHHQADCKNSTKFFLNTTKPG